MVLNNAYPECDNFYLLIHILHNCNSNLKEAGLSDVYDVDVLEVD